MVPYVEPCVKNYTQIACQFHVPAFGISKTLMHRLESVLAVQQVLTG